MTDTCTQKSISGLLDALRDFVGRPDLTEEGVKALGLVVYSAETGEPCIDSAKLSLLLGVPEEKLVAEASAGEAKAAGAVGTAAAGAGAFVTRAADANTDVKAALARVAVMYLSSSELKVNKGLQIDVKAEIKLLEERVAGFPQWIEQRLQLIAAAKDPEKEGKLRAGLEQEEQKHQETRQRLETLKTRLETLKAEQFTLECIPFNDTATAFAFIVPKLKDLINSGTLTGLGRRLVEDACTGLSVFVSRMAAHKSGEPTIALPRILENAFVIQCIRKILLDAGCVDYRS